MKRNIVAAGVFLTLGFSSKALATIVDSPTCTMSSVSRKFKRIFVIESSEDNETEINENMFFRVFKETTKRENRVANYKFVD